MPRQWYMTRFQPTLHTCWKGKLLQFTIDDRRFSISAHTRNLFVRYREYWILATFMIGTTKPAMLPVEERKQALVGLWLQAFDRSPLLDGELT